MPTSVDPSRDEPEPFSAERTDVVELGDADDVEDLAALGARLRDCRQRLHLSQQAVSSRVGINRPGISEIENGRRRVDSLELRRFALLYGRSADELLGTVPGPEGGEAIARDLVAGLDDGQLADLALFAEFLRLRGSSDLTAALTATEDPTSATDAARTGMG